MLLIEKIRIRLWIPDVMVPVEEMRIRLRSNKFCPYPTYFEDDEVTS
jgi:hypothetical protein